MTTTTKALTKVQEAERRFKSIVAQSTSPEAAGFGRMLSSDAFKQQLAAALPRHLTPERMIRVVQTVLQNTPAVMSCDPKSIIASIVRASQLGLEPDGVLGQAYLVPFGKQCTLIIGYRGLISLALRSGQVRSIMAEVVHSGDDFEFAYGLEQKLVHRPRFGGARGEPVAAYAIAELKDGGKVFRVMPREDIEHVRQGSQGRNSDAWKNHWGEMARKTVVRNLAKYLPQSPEFHRESIRDEYIEQGVIDASSEVLDIEMPKLEEHADVPHEREPGQEG